MTTITFNIYVTGKFFNSHWIRRIPKSERLLVIGVGF